MVCPLCNYEYGWVESGEHTHIEGGRGPFFSIPLVFERRNKFGQKESAKVFGCPQCHGMFWK